MILVINGETYQTNEYTPEVYESWRSFGTSLAKRNDKPLARFIEKHLDGLTGQDRRDALAAFIASENWDAPLESQIMEAMQSGDGVAFLLYKLIDGVDLRKIREEMATDANLPLILKQIQVQTNPTDDDIRESNRIMRERIARASEKASNEKAE